MSHVRKLGPERFQARWYTPEGREQTKVFRKKTDADNHCTAMDHAVLSGTYVDASAGKVKVSTMAEQWMATKVNIKPTTRSRLRSILDVHVLPRWGATPLGRVTHGSVQSWVADLTNAGLSPATVKKVYGALSGLLAEAVRDRRLPANPCEGVKLPRIVQTKRRYLSAEQVEDLADAAATPTGRSRGARSDQTFAQNRLVVYVLAYTGLRWGEVAGLRVSAVDLLRRRVNVSEAVVDVDGAGLQWTTPKDHESRSVGIPPFLVDLLATHMAGKQPGDLLFESPNGGPLRHRAERRAWFSTASKMAGASGLTPHELRHTAASLAVSAGANVKAVQRMLGHASAAMTLDIYADLFESDVDEVAGRLGKVREQATESRRNRGSVTIMQQLG